MSDSKYFDGAYFIVKQDDKIVRKLFIAERALIYLLSNDIVFLNSRHWAETDKELISVSVNCNDLFMWACADAQFLPFNQIEILYNMCIKDIHNGSNVWCCIQRNMMPQKEIEDKIRQDGIWDLDSYNLKPNPVEEYYNECDEDE